MGLDQKSQSVVAFPAVHPVVSGQGHHRLDVLLVPLQLGMCFFAQVVVVRVTVDLDALLDDAVLCFCRLVPHRFRDRAHGGRFEDPPSAGGRLGAVCSHTGHHVAGHLLHIAEIQQVHAIFNGLCRGGICVHKVIDVHPPYRSAVVCPHDPCPQVSVILFQQKGVQQAPLALEQGSLAGGVDGAPGLDVHLSDAKGSIRSLIVVLQGLRCKVEDAVGGHARPLLQLIVSGQIVGSAVHLRHKSLEISQHALGIQLVTQVKQLFRLGHITQPDRFAVLFHHQPRFLVLQGGVHRVLVTAECRVDLVWNGRLKAAELVFGQVQHRVFEESVGDASLYRVALGIKDALPGVPLEAQSARAVKGLRFL